LRRLASGIRASAMNSFIPEMKLYIDYPLPFPVSTVCLSTE